MSTPSTAAGRRGWPAVSRLALGFVSLWIPLLALALATGWGEHTAEEDSRLADYALNGSAVNGPLSAQLILLVLAVGAHRGGRIGLVATGLLAVMGAAITYNGVLAATADDPGAPQAVATIAGIGFVAFGVTLLVTAVRSLLLPRPATAPRAA